MTALDGPGHVPFVRLPISGLKESADGPAEVGSVCGSVRAHGGRAFRRSPDIHERTIDHQSGSSPRCRDAERQCGPGEFQQELINIRRG
jgi:hypothetical protein